MTLTPDRRFGNINKFGDTNKFGASGTGEQLSWGFEVDWNGDGVFDGTNEAQYLRTINIDRGRKTYLKPKGQGLETFQTGRGTFTLDNSSGRYDPWNTAGALYPNVGVGKDVRVTVRDMSGAATPYNVFYGVISDIIPSGYGADAYVSIYVEDGWAFLRNYTARVDVQTNITPDAAIGEILDYIAWPSRWGRSLDASSDAIRYWWASNSKQAGSEIEDIAISFLANFFISAAGQARLTIRSNTIASGVSFLQEILLKDIGNPQPWEIQRNTTRIKVHPRTASAVGSTLYQLLGNAPLIADGATNALELFCNYTYNNVPAPASVIIQPVSTTDWTTNTAADGSGTDKTALCTVTATSLGDTAKVIVTNASGGNVYLTKLVIRGTAIYEQNSAAIIYPATAPTQPREFLLDLLWQQDVNTASDFSTVIGQYLNSLHPTPSIKVIQRPTYQYGIELMDIVTTGLTKLGISGVSFRIGGIEHSGTPQDMTTRFYLEPYISSLDFWAWDTASVFDTTTVFGW